MGRMRLAGAGAGREGDVVWVCGCVCERESGGTEIWWRHGILFEKPNPNQEPPKRPNWALVARDFI